MFQWISYPEVDEFIFQLFEDGDGSTSWPKDCDEILHLIRQRFGMQMGVAITSKTLSERLRKIVARCREDESFTLQDLFTRGLDILSFEKLQRVIDRETSLSKEHGTATGSTSKTNRATNAAKGLNADTQKRPKTASSAPAGRLKLSIHDILSNSSSVTLSDTSEGDKEWKEGTESSITADDHNASLGRNAAGNRCTENDGDGKDEEDVGKRRTVRGETNRRNHKGEQHQGYQVGSYPRSQQDPEDTPYDRYINRHLTKTVAGNYTPSEPPNPPIPYDEDKIQRTMSDLAARISQTIHIEIVERGIDGSRPFYFDERRLDAAAMRIIEKLFGSGWKMSDLKSCINEASTERCLMLQTFLAAFVGASVTINALEALPQGQIDEASTEFDLYQQLLRFLRDGGTRYFELGQEGDLLVETAQHYVIQNHIFQHVIPRIDERAGKLAYSLRSHLFTFFTPEAHARWDSLPRSLVPLEDVFSNSTDLLATDNPTAVNDIRRLEDDRLFGNLKDIFKRTLTARAQWEICGEAKYEFSFPQFLGWYDGRVHEANEDHVDPSRPHQVFISTLPGVWARFRDNQVSPWQKPMCITKSVVFLIDL